MIKLALVHLILVVIIHFEVDDVVKQLAHGITECMFAAALIALVAVIVQYSDAAKVLLSFVRRNRHVLQTKMW